MQGAPIHAGRVHTDQHLIVSDLGLVDVRELEDSCGAVGVLDNGLHRGLPGRGGLGPVVERTQATRPDIVSRGASMLDSYIYGFALQETNLPFQTSEELASAR